MSQRYLGGVITANPTTPTMTTESGVWTLEQQFQYSSVWSPKIVGNSVRLRNSASGYFSRTYSTSPTNSRINTFSGWVKRGTLGSLGYLFTAYDGSSALAAGIWFQNDKLWAEYGGPSGSGRITTTAVYRDPSAWYHIVLSINTTQATASDRVKLYVNGVQVTAFDTATNPTFNLATAFTFPNGNNRVGANWDNSGPFDGYLAEVNFIDGQALTPASFGAFDSTGVWQPLPYTGTYGTNGFYLTFSDNSAATAAALGKDTSGNGNNWTPNNVSLTAGVTYDWMLDSPTNWTNGTGNGVANYCVMNPLDSRNITNTFTLNGNLGVNNPSTGTNDLMRATFMIPSGKWYWEATLTSGSSYWGACIIRENSALAYTSLNSGDAYAYSNNGTKNNGQTSTAYGNTYTAGDVVMVAFDSASGKIWFGKNGTWQASGDPVAATNEAFSGISGNYFPGVLINTSVVNFNFGQRPFAYTPPTGFKALNTLNLPDPTIMNGAQYMAATLYTGNGSTQTVNNSAGFYPDFNWIKSRSNVGSHVLVNSVAGGTRQLFSNLTDAEQTNTNITNGISSSGIALGNNSTGTGSTNQSAYTYVLWQWLAGRGTTSSNTAGSITSTVSVNTTAGFSVVTWAGNSTSGATIGHGLGVAPKLIITKSRTNASSWVVGIGNISGFSVNDYLSLNSTNGKLSSSTFYQAYGASTFTVGVSAADEMNKTGNNYVSYLFAQVAGYSAFGSYTGNGSTDGPFIYLGFRPRFILLKRTDTTGNWTMYDTARNPYNPGTYPLYPNLSNAEDPSTDHFDWLSNGFKMRSTNQNTNGGTFIYAAFAENPFKIARAR